nr:MAG TPA: hypothetical protein [Crassvirales sp.]
MPLYDTVKRQLTILYCNRAGQSVTRLVICTRTFSVCSSYFIQLQRAWSIGESNPCPNDDL